MASIVTWFPLVSGLAADFPKSWAVTRPHSTSPALVPGAGREPILVADAVNIGGQSRTGPPDRDPGLRASDLLLCPAFAREGWFCHLRHSAVAVVCARPAGGRHGL